MNVHIRIENVSLETLGKVLAKIAAIDHEIKKDYPDAVMNVEANLS